MTLIYFVPVFIIFSLSIFYSIYSYSNSIYSFDDAIAEVVFSEGSGFIGFEEIGSPKASGLPPIDIINAGNIGDTGIPNISIAEIGDIQDSIFSQSVKPILFLLFVVTIIFGILAHYLSRKSLQPLEDALEKQKRFVSDSSHEIKTPLALIKTEAEVLLKDENSTLEEYKEFTKNTINDVNRLNGLVSGLLQLAQLDHKEEKIILKKINLFDILNEVEEKFENISKRKNIKIDKKISENVFILGDKDKTLQVLHIIFDNALKYSDSDSSVTVRQKDEKNFIILEIKNNGKKVGQKDMEHIFDRFYRVSKDRNERGYGLGLSIAKEVMEKQNGFIKMNNENGKIVVSLGFKK